MYIVQNIIQYNILGRRNFLPKALTSLGKMLRLLASGHEEGQKNARWILWRKITMAQGF